MDGTSQAIPRRRLPPQKLLRDTELKQLPGLTSCCAATTRQPKSQSTDRSNCGSTH